MFLGIDPSLNATGIVIVDKDANVLYNHCYQPKIQESKLRDETRLRKMLITSQFVINIIKEHNHPIVAIEGSGVGGKAGRFGNQLFLLENLGILKSQIYLSTKKMPHIVPPPTWKKTVIGNGRAKKDMIKENLTEKGYQLDKQDEYDALGIALYLQQISKVWKDFVWLIYPRLDLIKLS